MISLFFFFLPSFLQVTINWNVIAGDGVGQLTARIDPTGGSSFADKTVITLTGSGANPTTTGAFTAQIPLPSDVTCDTCTIQVKSSSNWFSCATVKIQAGTVTQTVPPPALGTCISPVGLTFCHELNGKSLNGLPDGRSATTVDAELSATHDNYLANTNVFQPISQDQCSENYRKYLCATTFTKCGATTQSCQSYCSYTTYFCALQSSHAGLYDCSLNNGTTSDAFGSCSAAGTLSAALFTVLAGIVAAFYAAL